MFNARFTWTNFERIGWERDYAQAKSFHVGGRPAFRAGAIGMTNRSIHSEESGIKPQASYWRRQFLPKATFDQRVFDWIFGVILPVGYIFIDPIVFRAFYGEAILGEFKPFAYLLSFAAIVMLMGRLLLGDRLRSFNSVVSGLFAAGSLASFSIGSVLFLYCLLNTRSAATYLLIGAIGYVVPFVSAFVYMRNGVRAFNGAGLFLDEQTLAGVFMLSAVFSVAVPAVVNARINGIVDQMATGTAEQTYSAAEDLKYIYPLANFDRVGKRYCYRYLEKEKRRALGDVYKHFTGQTTRALNFNLCGVSGGGEE